MENTLSSEILEKTTALTAQIYTLRYDLLLEYVVESLRDVLSFSHSLYHYIRQKPGSINYVDLRSNDIPKSDIDAYINKYSKIDFINWYSLSPKIGVFRESDIISLELLENSQFMQEWMLPIGIYYGVGMSIADGENLFGSIFLYRSQDEEDFSDQDLNILNIVNHHLCQRFSTEFPHGLDELPGSDTQSLLHLKTLTKRENEILTEIQAGTLRRDLSGKMFITENTLNKHLDNIYKKLGIDSYEQLLQIIRMHSNNL